MTEELSRKYPGWNAADLQAPNYIKAIKSMIFNNDLDAIDSMLSNSTLSRSRAILKYLPIYAVEQDKVDILHYVINKRGKGNMDDLDYREYLETAIRYKNPAVFKYLINFDARYTRKEQNLFVQTLLSKLSQDPRNRNLHDDLEFVMDSNIFYNKKDIQLMQIFNS